MRVHRILLIIQRSWSFVYSHSFSVLKRLTGFNCCHWFNTVDVLFFCALPLSMCLSTINSLFTLPLSLLSLFLVVKFLFNTLENNIVYARNAAPFSRTLSDTPDRMGFYSWEHIKLLPDGARGPLVTGHLILHDDPTVRSSLPTIYILHGNAGNVGHRNHLCRRLFDSISCNILIIDYRGFGLSTGVPNERGIYSDAHAGFSYMLNHPDIASDKIFVYGQSLGGGVAVELATKYSGICGVIVENSFTSVPLLAHHRFGKFLRSATRIVLPECIFSNHYASLSRLRSAKRLPPFLFLSGGQDEVIPPSMMEQLAVSYGLRRHSETNMIAEFMSPSKFITSGFDGLVRFSAGTHNETWLQPKWIDVISRFVQYHCSNSVSDPTGEFV